MTTALLGFGKKFLALALLAAPSVASACASCAARPDEGNRTVYFIAAMCLLPLVVGGAAVAIVRRLDADGEPSAQAPAVGGEER